jgi:hypothetical protein
MAQLKIICKRCGAGPYTTLSAWDNHIECHRDNDNLQEELQPGSKVQAQVWIKMMETQVAEIDALVQAMSASSPQPITVITQPRSRPRIYQGYTTLKVERTYVETYHRPRKGQWVEFDHVNLFSDLGESNSCHRWTFDGRRWDFEVK